MKGVRSFPHDTAWLRLIADHSPFYAAYIQSDGRHVYANPRYASWFNRSPDELIGKTLSEISHNPNSVAAVDPLQKQALSGQHVRFEISLPRGQGESASLACEYIPNIDPATGKVLGIAVLAQDVTERHQARAAIESHADRFRALTNTIPQLMWTADARGQVDFVNDRCLKYSGVTSAEKYGERWVDALHPDDKQRVYSEWSTSIQTSTPFKAEYRLADYNGIYRWFLGHAVPIFSSTGELDYWIGTATDIEEERQRANELTQAKLAAESASRAKSAFLANMSHEIRTPLGMILGCNDLLHSSGLSDAERKSFAEIAERNGKALTRIIDDLLDLARIEAGRILVDRTPFSVRELLDDVKSLFRDRAAEKKIGLTLSVDASVPHAVESDPIRVRQILINIIGNAVKFTDQGEISVSVQARPHDDGKLRLLFVVRDTGCGMTEDQRARLFQPFSQADDSSTRQHGGAGLGLAISMRLAQALGGNIEVAPFALEKGCTFVVTVLAAPIARNAARSSNSPTTESDGLAGSDLAGLKILVVDDSQDNLQLLEYLLRSKGVSVFTAGSGVEAIELALREPFDVVLMDIQMPVMDGYQTMELLRKNGLNTPVIALTAHAMESDRNRSMEMGFAHHLTKPLNKNELFAVVGRIGRRT